jgi:ribose transport system permease protein
MKKTTSTYENNRGNTRKYPTLIKLIRKWGLLLGLILLVIVFSLAAEKFLTVMNIANILRQGTIIGIMALGMTFAMIVGDFDLSFASLTGLLNVINISLIIQGWNLVPVFILTLTIGICWGLFNSVLIVKVGIHAFIATLATMTIARGIIYWITKGKTLYGPYPESLTVIGRGNILFNLLPIATLIFLVVAIMAYILANHTKIGRYFYSVGGNPQAAIYSGIKVNLYRTAGITISSFCSAIAAIILTSKLTSAPPDAGEGYLMSAIPVVFLGTTFLKPGVVNVGGTVVATILIAVIENGLIMLNVPFYFKYMIQGGIIILAIASITGGSKKKLGGPAMF